MSTLQRASTTRPEGSQSPALRRYRTEQIHPPQACDGTSVEDLAHVRDIVEASGTSFLGAIRTLPKPRREAMYAIYAFCREVDDIADDPIGEDRKRAELAEWRDEIDRLFESRPLWPTSRALLTPAGRYELQREDFIALIDGMEMDATDAMRGPSMETLQLYCDRVAGAVGRLSIRVFGATEDRARDVAWSLGQALQLTNILRDIREDAQRGRLYLPAELLAKHGVPAEPIDAALAHPDFEAACVELAEIAERRFREASAAIAACDLRPMRPAIVMMQVYHRILAKLTARGWRRLDQPVHVSKLVKLWIALRYGLL